MANKKEVKAYLKKSSVSWCGFVATNIGLKKQRGMILSVKGSKYVIVKFKFYKCYIIQSVQIF